MKPELVSYSFGHHNEWMEASTRRMEESALWKRQRVVVILPAANTMSTKVALSMWNLVFPPNNGVARILAVGQEVGEAYNNAIQAVLDHPDLSQWEFILTVEHDNLLPPDGLVKLLQRMDQHPELSCISGLYWTKFEGGVAQIWGSPDDPVLNFRPQPPRAGELVECCGLGMGMALFRLSMFKDEKLRKPWFKTGQGLNGEGVCTQDLYAWADFRKHGHRCGVDCSVLVGHYDSAGDFTW